MPPSCFEDNMVGESREEDMGVGFDWNSSLLWWLISNDSDCGIFRILVGDFEASTGSWWISGWLVVGEWLICVDGFISFKWWSLALICWVSWGEEIEERFEVDPMLFLKKCSAMLWLVISENFNCYNLTYYNL